MELQKQITQLINTIATKHNLPNYVIEEIYKQQYNAIREWIRSGEHETIHLMKWGKFIVSEAKVDFIKRKNARKRTITENSSNTLS